MNIPVMISLFKQKGAIVEKLTEEALRDWSHFKELVSFCEGRGFFIILFYKMIFHNILVTMHALFLQLKDRLERHT